MIAVSAVSLLLIVTLTTVTPTQCLLIIRMRRSRDRSETYAEATNSTTKTTDVPVSLNEAYELTKIMTEEVTYGQVRLTQMTQRLLLEGILSESGNM